MTPSTVPGSTRRRPPNAAQVGLDGPRCPACGSTFVVRPSPWDTRQLWRCERCGAVWTAPTVPEPAARRHLSDPFFRWSPEGTL
jgi:ribosomal protein L37AE/L43A